MEPCSAEMTGIKKRDIEKLKIFERNIIKEKVLGAQKTRDREHQSIMKKDIKEYLKDEITVKAIKLQR